MSNAQPNEVLSRLGGAVFYVSVKMPNKDFAVGSAFHIGRGYFATARHVIDGNEIIEMGSYDVSMKTRFSKSGGTTRTTTSPGKVVKGSDIERYWTHQDEKVDVAILKAKGWFSPEIQLDSQIDWLTEGETLMREVLVLGYPPIPFTAKPHMVIFRGEISAVVEHRWNKQKHLVISGMARGGFSGGAVVELRSPTYGLGIVTESLVGDIGGGVTLEELGFLAALSPKTIFEVVDHHKLPIPEVQATYKGFMLHNTLRSC